MHRHSDIPADWPRPDPWIYDLAAERAPARRGRRRLMDSRTRCARGSLLLVLALCVLMWGGLGLLVWGALQ